RAHPGAWRDVDVLEVTDERRHGRINDHVARHQIFQPLPVRADALSDRARQALIGIRLVIDPLGVDERHALLLETLAARNEEVWPGDRRDGDPALGGAQAAATVTVD